mmetsp:Transcript_26546/g.82031  ORF Transcript_26546/g.82031 Transcript_26546/m.82031 type:complete len:417 (-) Transcript_26546:2665-3915(-)
MAPPQPTPRTARNASATMTWRIATHLLQRSPGTRLHAASKTSATPGFYDWSRRRAHRKCSCASPASSCSRARPSRNCARKRWRRCARRCSIGPSSSICPLSTPKADASSGASTVSAALSSGSFPTAASRSTAAPSACSRGARRSRTTSGSPRRRRAACGPPRWFHTTRSSSGRRFRSPAPSLGSCRRAPCLCCPTERRRTGRRRLTRLATVQRRDWCTRPSSRRTSRGRCRRSTWATSCSTPRATSTAATLPAACSSAAAWRCSQSPSCPRAFPAARAPSLLVSTPNPRQPRTRTAQSTWRRRLRSRACAISIGCTSRRSPSPSRHHCRSCRRWNPATRHARKPQRPPLPAPHRRRAMLSRSATRTRTAAPWGSARPLRALPAAAETAAPTTKAATATRFRLTPPSPSAASTSCGR